MSVDSIVGRHQTSLNNEDFFHNFHVPEPRALGWKERVVERVVTAQAKGIIYNVIVKALAIFTLMLLSLSIIGAPIGYWANYECTRQINEEKFRTSLKSIQDSCAHSAEWMTTEIENHRPQFIQHLGLDGQMAQSFETTALLRQLIAKDPLYPSKFHLTNDTQTLPSSTFNPEPRKLGWKERVIEKVVATEDAGLAYTIFVKSIAVFALMLLSLSIIGAPVGHWAVHEYTRQVDEQKYRGELNKIRASCAYKLQWLSKKIEDKRPQFIKHLGLEAQAAQSFETTALLRQLINNNQSYLSKHPLT